MSEDSRTDGGPVTPKDSDAASIESNAKEVVVMHTQKEHLPDPDLLPQAVYPRGLPAWIELRRPGDGPPTPVIVVDMRRPLESSGQEQSRDGSINLDSPVIAVRHYYPEGATSLSGSTVSDSASVTAPSSNGTGPKIMIMDKEAGGDIRSDAASEEARSRNDSSTKAQRKILGFRRRTFWICFAFLALLVIGGIVGGVVGGIIASNDMARRPFEAIAPATNQTSSLRLADTRIAAANWTTAEGRVYSALFTQDPTGAISMSRWDQAAKRWTVTNVTQKVLDNGFTGFAAKLGTPMAAISTGPPVYDFEMRLYYVGLGDNVLVEVMTQDPTAQNWTMGEYRRVAPRVVSPTSDLSAAWVRCGTCNDEIHVMYTDRRNFINLVNSSDWQRLHNAIGPRPGGGFLVHPQTSMLVMPALRFNTTTNTTEPEGVAGMFNTGSGIDPTAKVDDTFDTSPPKTTRLRVGVHNGTMWRDGGLEEPAGEFYPGEITDVRRQLVGIPYDDYRKAIVFYLIANGTLVGYQMTYNATIPSWQRDVPIKIVGGPAASLKIKSIAMTWTKQVFALTSMGIVEEYRWTPDDPFTIMYEGPVIHKADLVSVPVKAR